MTKEEIFNEEAPFVEIHPSDMFYVEKAMEIYAKQQAIAFAIEYNGGIDDRMDVRYEHFLYGGKLQK